MPRSGKPTHPRGKLPLIQHEGHKEVILYAPRVLGCGFFKPKKSFANQKADHKGEVPLFFDFYPFSQSTSRPEPHERPFRECPLNEIASLGSERSIVHGQFHKGGGLSPGGREHGPGLW